MADDIVLTVAVPEKVGSAVGALLAMSLTRLGIMLCVIPPTVPVKVGLFIFACKIKVSACSVRA